MFNFLKNLYDKYKEDKEKKQNNISLWSYQRFCRFYGITVFLDQNFDEKISKILELVNDKNCEDIKTIAEEANCNYKECVLKLRYLKNKMKIDYSYYINSFTGKIKKCSDSDLELIYKYYEMVYHKHYSIYEMKIELNNKNEEKKYTEEDIYKELLYLSDRALLSGIDFDEKTHEILYYTLEKRKMEEKYVTLNCPNCGALVDVIKFDRGRCSYCKTLVEDTYSKREGE